MSSTTEIVINEQGDETHESWVRLVASKVSSTGTRLFDSEINHHRFVSISVERCTRKRDLSRDFLYNTEKLCEFAMSEAQWGAFVSSFGDGGGVPATLTWLQGPVSSAPFESRLDESHREVRAAGTKALDEIQAAYNELAAAFEEGAGKKVMRDHIRGLGIRLKNGPSNMEFAAKSLTEHVENVVTKARVDIEGMLTAAGGERQLEGVTSRLLGQGEDDDDEGGV